MFHKVVEQLVATPRILRLLMKGKFNDGKHYTTKCCIFDNQYICSAEIIWPHCKCASDLMDVIGVSSPLLSVNFMQRKNPGIFLTCFAKRPKIDDIPRDKLFIIIEWLWKISLKNIVSSWSRTSQTSALKRKLQQSNKKQELQSKKSTNYQIA